jgi:hypothetical protein
VPTTWPIQQPLYQIAGSNPTFDIDCARTRSLNDVVTGRNFTSFSRASTASYVDGDGIIKTAAVNQPRFDHDPVTGQCKGLLIEEARTNALSDSMPTTSGGTGIANTLVTDLPGIFSTGRRLTANSSTTDQRITVGISTSGVTTAYSFFARLGSQGTTIFLRLGTSSFAEWNLSSGSVTRDDFASSKIINYGNGWYRCYSIITGNGAGFLMGIGSGLYATAGDNIVIAGVQLENAASFPSSYIPTTGSTVTRAADVCSINNPGAMYGTQHTLLFDGALQESGNATPSLTFLNFRWMTNPNQLRDTGNQNVGLNTSASSTTRRKHVFGLQTANLAVSIDGGSASTSSNSIIPSGSAIGFNNLGNILNGTLARILYWPKRLRNNTLVRLSK